jgi:hypothetical protein
MAPISASIAWPADFRVFKAMGVTFPVPAATRKDKSRKHEKTKTRKRNNIYFVFLSTSCFRDEKYFNYALSANTRPP